MRTYRFIAYPKGAGIKVIDLRLWDYNEKLIDTVIQSLKSKDKILPKYSITYLLDNIIKFNGKKCIPIGDLLKQIKQNRNLALVIKDSALLDSIQDAVREGFIGYNKDLVEFDQTYIGTIGKDAEVKWIGYVIEKSSIYVPKPSVPTSPILEQQHNDTVIPFQTISIGGESDLSKLEPLKKVEHIMLEVSANGTRIGEILTELYINTRSIDIVGLKLDALFKKDNMAIRVTGDVIIVDIKKIFDAIKNMANLYVDNVLKISLHINQKDGSELKDILESLVVGDSVQLELKYNG